MNEAALVSTQAVGTKLTTTTQTTVYTADTANGNMHEVLIAVLVANVTSTDATVTVEWTDASAADTYSLATGMTVPANGTVWLRPINMPLDDADAIKATAGTANALHVVTMVNEKARGGRDAG